ncbi:hypothetical protein SHJG_0749 [Streptomyces hygroscopicus subsp. jinggangensis 5008]|nr:hypothetical protein SHJG_0749 [Streptomyces hygroscopicus subsp. jinggangensis 5008]AGF60248.1 hypothetical protein SHJGH_0582 [Streptomyces hygroscopicus subsp. jinggangensis TL01]
MTAPGGPAATNRRADSPRRFTVPIHRTDSPRPFAALLGAFPCTERCAAELTARAVQDRFGLVIGLMIDGLPVAPRGA